MADSLSYTGRDATDIKRELVDLVPKLTDDWKDFNESDLGITVIELIAGAQDMQNFYFDTQTFETYLDTAVQDKNIRSLLRSMNYKIPLIGSAKGEVTVVFTGELADDFVIPKYTQFTYSEDSTVSYVASDEVVAKAGELQVQVPVIQGVPKTIRTTKNKLVANTTISGKPSRRIYLSDTNVADGSVTIDQGGEIWTEVTDALLEYNGGRYFSVHKDSSDKVFILMSVDFVDLLPSNGDEEILIKYVVSSGTSGVVTEGMIDTCRDESIDLDLVTQVYNTDSTYGAYDAPNLQNLKVLAREQAQTMDRYITLSDYKNGVATEPYVMKYLVHDWRTSEDIKIPYVVYCWAVDYQGNNLGDVDKQTLKNKFIDKGSTTVSFEYQVTEFVDVDLEVTIELKNTTSESNVNKIREVIKSALTDKFALENLEYGQYISRTNIQSLVYSASSYIRDAEVVYPEKDVKLEETQFPRINSVKVTVVDWD